MSDDKDAGFDPRFDPAFQRGFDPAAPIEEYVPDPLPRKSASSHREPAAAEPVPRAPVAPAREPAGPSPAEASLAEASPTEATALVAEAEEPDDPAENREPDSSPSRNPFLLLLGIIAVALVAAGVWLFVRSGDAFNSREVRSQGDYMSLDATIHAAPFIALLGGATAIGVLFVFAAKWRRRR